MSVGARVSLNSSATAYTSLASKSGSVTPVS